MTIETKDRDIRRGYGSETRPVAKDLWARDGSQADHPAVRAEGNVDPDYKQIDYRRYYDPEYARKEHERLWMRSWLYACREEDLPNVGDRLVYFGTVSFVIVKVSENSYKAFFNSCLHRGTALCSKPESGDVLRCPFHAWEWKLDGSLKFIPSHWDFTHVKPKDSNLQEAKVGRWGGFIYINADVDAPPFEKVLGVLPQHFHDYGFEERHTVAHLRKEIRANWKLVQEAFMESYHVYATHPMAVPFTGDSQSRYDIFDDGVGHVGRQITPSAVPSMHAGPDETMFSAAAAFLYFIKVWHYPEAELPVLDPQRDAREQFAQWFRDLETQRLGRECRLTDAALVDSSLYFLFPNTTFWMCESIPFFYSFTPHESDPTRSYFEVRLLKRLPAGQAHVPASRIEIGPDTKIEEAAPAFGPLSVVFDQDMSNLPLVQRGVQSASPRRPYATLGNYQEFIIQHWHTLLDRVMADRVPEGQLRRKPVRGQTMKLNEIIAHLEIRQTLARYCRGVDRQDADLIRSVYHQDANDDHGIWKGKGWDFATWIVDQLKPISLSGTHQITTVYIELNGATAKVESYYMAVNPMKDAATGREYLLLTGGRYLDRFELRDQKWLIADRVCTIDWSRNELAGEPWVGQASFARVGPRGADASDGLFSS